MGISVVQLGSPRSPEEGLRLGTVRRPPRGVPKKDFARRDFYDLWLPILSPSAALLKKGHLATTEKDWQKFEKAFRKEMKAPAPSQTLDLLAALSHTTNFSIGCYCENEQRCHRSILQALLSERGGQIRQNEDDL